MWARENILLVTENDSVQMPAEAHLLFFWRVKLQSLLMISHIQAKNLWKVAATVHVLTSCDGEGSHSKPDLRADVSLLPWIIRNEAKPGKILRVGQQYLGTRDMDYLHLHWIFLYVGLWLYQLSSWERSEGCSTGRKNAMQAGTGNSLATKNNKFP